MKINFTSIYKFLFKIYKYYFWLLFAVVMTFFVYAFYVMSSRTPNFLYEIKDDVLSNDVMMRRIGDMSGYEIDYKSNYVEGEEALFQVRVVGKCDSAYILVRGRYSKYNDKYTYVVRDTTVSEKCF